MPPEPGRPSAGPAPASSAWDLVADVRQRGGRVVATGGCFDLLHAGHVGLLRQARRLALAETRSLAAHAARDRDARAALAGAARRLPRALAARRRLPDEIEQQIKILAAAEQAGLLGRDQHTENMVAAGRPTRG